MKYDLRMVIENDRLTLRPPRLWLAALFGVLTGGLIFAYGLLAILYPPRPHMVEQSAPHRGGTGIHWTPPEAVGRQTEEISEAWYLRLLKAPWAPVLIGVSVYFLCKQVFRVHIVLDKGQNMLLRDGRVVCPLSDILFVEVDDTPRTQVMNEMALGLAKDRRFSLLLYNGSAGKRLHGAAESVAEFAGVPVKVRKDYSFFRKKKRD